MLQPAGFAQFGKLQSDQQRFFTVLCPLSVLQVTTSRISVTCSDFQPSSLDLSFLEFLKEYFSLFYSVLVLLIRQQIKFYF